MLVTTYKICFWLCFVALAIFTWIFWKWFDLSVGLSMTFKDLDAQWQFNNQPTKMLFKDEYSEKAVVVWNEQLDGERRLLDMKLVYDLNSDPLPKHSHFGTMNATGICEGTDAKRCAPIYLKLENRIRTAPKYWLIACIIHKSLSTIIQAVMCFLYDEQAFLKAGRTFQTELSKIRFCRGKNEYAAVHKAENAVYRSYLTRNASAVDIRPMLLASVRHPISRFLSGFVDKCIRKPVEKKYCNGCKANMTCFIITEYERLIQQVRQKRLSRTFEDMHFFPQNWRCDFDKQFKKYHLLHYDSHPMFLKNFVSQLEEMLKAQGVPQESLVFISDHIQNGRTIHSTVSSSARNFLEKRLKSSPYLLEFLVRMFYNDFKLFEYKLPKIEFPNVV